MTEGLAYEYVFYFIFACWGIGVSVVFWADLKSIERMKPQPVRVRRDDGRRIRH